MEKEERSEAVEFEWKKAEDYRSFYINGVFGGRGPRGDIHMQLIRDRPKLPKHEGRRVAEGRKLKRKEKEEKPTFIREVLGEIYLTRENAFSIATWMLEKVLPEEIGQEEIQEVLIKEFELPVKKEEGK